MMRFTTLLLIAVLMFVGNLHSQKITSKKSLEQPKFELLEEIVFVGYYKPRMCDCPPTISRVNKCELVVSDMPVGIATVCGLVDPSPKHKGHELSLGRDLAGIVLDSKSLRPVEFATLCIVDTLAFTTTNNNGIFKLRSVPIGPLAELKISAIGYESKVVPIQNPYGNPGPLTIYLDQRDPIPGIEMRCFFGLKQKASDKLFHNFSERTVEGYSLSTGFKIYPNPIQAGSSVKVEFKNDLVGVYKVEIVDASGRVLHSENVNVVFKNQSITISTFPNWSKGTYLIRLTETKQNSVYAGKLVLN